MAHARETKTARQLDSDQAMPIYPGTSELLRAAENQEWDKLMVRRPLEVVWYLQRMHPSHGSDSLLGSLESP
jgi:hypothetical protein